ncbi:MAG: FkbM family methyltransferase [Rhodanobacteraceae bacterium]
MPLLSSIAKKIQFAEGIVPPRWRLPVRYHGQRLVGGLEPEMALLADLVKRSDVALDVGANRGVYAYALANIATSVHCFEPLIECCRYIQAYKSDKIIVHSFALSDTSGLLRIYIPIIHGHAVLTRASLDRPSGESVSRDIKVRTLDSFAFPRVDFIKIDVEGFEAAMLRGAHKTIETSHPKLLVEIDHQRHTPESFVALHDWLASMGYISHVCDEGRLRKCNDPSADSNHHINFIFL